MVPMLSTRDKVQLMRCSRGFYACVKRQLDWHKTTLKKEYEGYWYFLQQFYKSTVLVENFMLERFRQLLKTGVKNIEYFTVSEEIMSVLVYYLCTKNRRMLFKLLHTVVPKLDPKTRRCFRRLYLRTELYLRQHRRPIKPPRKQQTKMSKVTLQNVVSSASSETKVVTLTEANLRHHNKRKANARVVRSPKRFKPEVTKLKDDLSASELGSEDIGIEERSIDSQSAGSLKDFIVDDDDESLEQASSRQEESLSDRETEDSQSFHSSALTDSESVENE